MTRPAFVKLGGAVLTDKAKVASLRRAVARRIIGEVAKADIPVVLFHGAGSFGHPAAATMQSRGQGAEQVAAVLAGVGLLHAEVVNLAFKAGLKPLSIPCHLVATSDGGVLTDLPVRRIEQALAEGFTPVLAGTIVRESDGGWRVVSADEWMAVLAPEFDPRVAVFATSVDGVLDADGAVIETVSDAEDVPAIAGTDGIPDVTGGMQGKVRNGLVVAEAAPTLIVNGMVRGRLLDALRGKTVPGTRLVA